MKRVLLCGFPRSGNTLVWNILYHYQTISSDFSSFCQKSGVGRLMEFYESEKLFHSQHSFVDNFAIINNKICFVYPKETMRYVEIDSDMFVGYSSILTTHEKVTSFIDFDFISKIDSMFYICRDPRAVYVSTCHHVVRPEYLKLLPNMKLKTVEEVMARKDLAEKWTRDWKEHVQSFLPFRHKFMLVKYEELIANKSCGYSWHSEIDRCQCSF